MSLLDVYSMREAGKMTEEEAARALGKSIKILRFTWTLWGHRLPLMLSTLDKITAGTITRSEAAKVLECTERQVNSLMRSWGVQRPVANHIVNKEQTKLKWSVRQKFAIDYIADTTTIEDAAENAQVSVRQMRRWVSNLLKKHYDMEFIDLRQITASRRRRLAEEIEEKEGLDLAKQQMMKAVLDGRKTIHEEAIDRAIMKRARRTGRVANVRR